MIENSISELFNSIESSPEYQEYQKIKEILESDQEVLSLVDEIKKLQKKSMPEYLYLPWHLWHLFFQ